MVETTIKANNCKFGEKAREDWECSGYPCRRQTSNVWPNSGRCKAMLGTITKKSLCRLSQEIGLSYSTCQRAAKKAKLKPYRVPVIQELLSLNKQKRVAYCEWFQNVFVECSELLDITWFHLSGYINTQNTRIWATDNSHSIHELPLHSEKTSAWCAISRRHIIGPIFSTALWTLPAISKSSKNLLNSLMTTSFNTATLTG